MGHSGSKSRRCMACAGVIQPSVLRGWITKSKQIASFTIVLIRDPLGVLV